MREVPDRRAYGEALHAHVHGFFGGHLSRMVEFDGPVQRFVPGFHVIEIAPGPRIGLFIYVSIGGGSVIPAGGRPLEFVIVADQPSARFVTLLGMACHYHIGNVLDVGHTVPLGEPWLAGATLDHTLVLLPYIFGPALEVFVFESFHAHLLWLIPISAAERALKAQYGLDALEQRFEAAQVEYWNSARDSVV